MLRSRVLALLIPSLIVVAPLRGQAPGANNLSVFSIVTVSFNAAVLGSAEAQRDLEVLQKKYSPREQQLQKLNDDIEASRRRLGDGTAMLSESERNQRVQDLNAKEKQLQRDAEDLKHDSETESQQAFQRVAQKMYAFLQVYAQQHGYSAVFDRGTDVAPVVWYAAKDLDITDQLTKAYNARPNGSASLPSKPGASRTPSANPNRP